MNDGTIFIVVLIVAVLATSIVMVVRDSSARGESADTPLDREAERQWLVTVAPSPVRRILESVDRRLAGGAVAAAAFAVLFVTAALVGWIFSGIDDERGVARWDSSAAEFGRDHATDDTTRALDILTDLGGTLYLFVAMALLGVFYAVRRSDAGPLAYLIAAGVGVALLNNGLKLLIDRDRPDVAQLAGSAGSSFPSGHTAAAAACWAAIFLVLARRQGSGVRRLAAAAAVFIAIVVAMTRVLLGVHWVSDVVAGLFVGWGWWLATTVVFGGRALRLGSPAAISDAETPNDESRQCGEYIRRSPQEVSGT